MMKKFCIFSILLLISNLIQAKNADDTLVHTLLWKITGNGLKSPSWLYGTMHEGNDMVFRLPDSALIAFDASNTFSPEIYIDSINKDEMLQSMTLPQGETLKTLLGDSDYKIAAKKFRKRTGFPLFMFQNFKPLFIYILMNDGRHPKDEVVLDDFYFKLAKQQNKTIIGLERPEDQMKMFDIFKIEDQVKMFRSTIHSANDTGETNDYFLRVYASANLNKIDSLTKSDTLMTPEYQNALIYNRNKVMATGMDHIMQSGETLFTAVGAAHLPGEKGIISLLRKKGYQVSPVICNNFLNPDSVRAKLK